MEKKRHSGKLGGTLDWFTKILFFFALVTYTFGFIIFLFYNLDGLRQDASKAAWLLYQAFVKRATILVHFASHVFEVSFTWGLNAVMLEQYMLSHVSDRNSCGIMWYYPQTWQHFRMGQKFGGTSMPTSTLIMEALLRISLANISSEFFFFNWFWH